MISYTYTNNIFDIKMLQFHISWDNYTQGRKQHILANMSSLQSDYYESYL